MPMGVPDARSTTVRGVPSGAPACATSDAARSAASRRDRRACSARPQRPASYAATDRVPEGHRPTVAGREQRLAVRRGIDRPQHDPAALQDHRLGLAGQSPDACQHLRIDGCAQDPIAHVALAPSIRLSRRTRAHVDRDPVRGYHRRCRKLDLRRRRRLASAEDAACVRLSVMRARATSLVLASIAMALVLAAPRGGSSAAQVGRAIGRRGAPAAGVRQGLPALGHRCLPLAGPHRLAAGG